MTVVISQGQENGGNAGQQYYYEDVRGGHNIGYLGNSRQPVNSITFTPIFGPEGGVELKNTSGARQNYTGAHYSPEYQTQGGGTLVHGGWLRLGNKKCPTVGVFTTGTTSADVADWFGNVLSYNWMSAVPDEQPVTMNVGLDDGATKNVHFQNNFGGLGEGYYGVYSQVQMNDGDEMFSKLPNYSTTNTSSNGTALGFAHSYKTGGSASYRGWHEISYASTNSSYHQFVPYVNFKRNQTSTVNRYTSFPFYSDLTYLGTYGGEPYYLNIDMDYPTTGIVIKTYRYNVDSNTMTQTFNGTVGASAVAVLSSNSSVDAGNRYPHGYNAGKGNRKGVTKWMTASSGDYRFLIIPLFSYNDYPIHLMLRMDIANNTIQYQGTSSGGYQTAMYGYSDNQLGYLDFNGTGNNPYDLSGSSTTSKQPGLAAIYSDWHGVYDVNQDEYFGPDYSGARCYNGQGVVNQLHSWFPAYGVEGRSDGSSNARRRRIFSYSWEKWPDDWSFGRPSKTYYRGFTTVPETPHNWVWLDEKRTLIAAMCSNNTYIYECRGYDIATSLLSGTNQRTVYYIGNTSNSGADAAFMTGIGSYNSAYTVPGFNGNPAARTGVGSFLGWVHVNTIPHRVVQMGIDKHEKIFAVTANITASGGTNSYGGNLHMWTQNTPFSVALGGNVTTDTITHSGSNIDKTLTIEALGIRGRNVKTKVQLEIVGTTGQFDNGTQSKEVTTSTSGTVSETITITGSSQFNIVANFGV